MPDDRRCPRLLVLLRPLLVVPHLGWLQLWGVIALASVVGNWFATLVLGRSPDGLHVFGAGFLRYATHVLGYLLVLAQPFPAFGGRRGYAVDLADVPRERQRRLMVLFRLVLALPALAAAAVAGGVACVVVALNWLVAVATGRLPPRLAATALVVLRFEIRVLAYLCVLTPRYPTPAAAAGVDGHRPDRQSA